MEISIDEAQCKKQELTISQMLVMYAASFTNDLSPCVSDLLARGMLVKEGHSLHISEIWKTRIDQQLFKTAGKVADEEQLASLAREYVQLWPKGKMVGLNGNAYYYRTGVRELQIKFKSFFANYRDLLGQYASFNEVRQAILLAARRYNANMDRTPRNRQLAKYFISKQVTLTDPVTGQGKIVERSELATYMENALHEKEDGISAEEVSSGDWTMNLRTRQS